VKNKIAQDTYLVGIGASPGIGIGEVSLVDQRPLVDHSMIENAEINAELFRFRQALNVASEQLQKVKQRVAGQPHLREHLYILDTHILILEDEMLVGGTEKAIRACHNAERALSQTLEQLRALFDNIDDEYLRERRSDVDAVGERLLRILTGVGERTIGNIGRKSLVVAHELSPAETMQMDKTRVLGFITDKGGRTSHTAILARSLNIPAVVGLETITTMVFDRVPVIIDGSTGVVILNPSENTFKEYLERKQSYEFLERDLENYFDLPPVTTDNMRISLRGNLEIASDVAQVKKHAAEGIGLYRTEFLYLGRSEPPDEDHQYQSYCEIIKQVDGLPVTIRTLDIGGDKFVPELNLEEEANPAMGLRGIRFSLYEDRLLRVQLRAILRASVCGRVMIMFPMISGVAEIRTCKRILSEIKDDLEREGIAYDRDVAIGIMIETPAAVMIAPLLAQEVDFFSIGTNDLIQYFLAVDRGNEHVAYLYEPLHPAILRALKIVCDAANDAGIKVCMCGEMAGEPLYTQVLIGLGLHALSMNPACVPRVKRVLRQVSKRDGELLVDKIVQLNTSKEVATVIEQEMRERLPDIFAQQLI